MTDNPPYSSPCGMADTDPAYHGFLDTEELRTLLATLLHAERAGVRVCHLSRHDAPTRRQVELLRDIQRDETRSCRGLIISLQSLGFEPDNLVGDFADQCLAIADFGDRLRFLNRGQGWVAKKVAEALPRVRQETVQRQLARMLEDHRHNIDHVNNVLESGL